jgi:hypothetical protein
VQAVGQDSDEGVRLDAWLVLVVNWPDRQIAFEIRERFLDLRELDLVTPQLGRVAAGEIGAQQITAFATPHLFELVAAEPASEVRALIVHLEFHQPPARA